MLFNRLQLFSFFYGIILFFIFGDTLLLVVFGETKTGTFVNNNHYSIKSNRSYYTRRYRSNHNYYKPVIQFTVTNNTYQFETTSNIDFEEGEKIPSNSGSNDNIFLRSVHDLDIRPRPK